MGQGRDGSSTGTGQASHWVGPCGPKAESSEGLVLASSPQGDQPTRHGFVAAQEEGAHSLPVEKVPYMEVPEAGVMGSE